MYPDLLVHKDFVIVADPDTLEQSISYWSGKVEQPTTEQLQSSWEEYLADVETERINMEKQEEIDSLKTYLADTDFYYIRKLEYGEAIPSEIKAQRIEARQSLNNMDINTIDKARANKRDELNYMCSETILGRFSSVVDGVTYYFSNDQEAQANFDKADRAFDKGLMTEISWTAYDGDGNVVRLVFNQATFEPLYMSHLTHIQDNISKFRDFLMPLVNSATTMEELEAISW